MISLIIFGCLFIFCVLYAQKSDLNSAKVIILISWVGGSLTGYDLIPNNGNDLIILVVSSLSIFAKALNGQRLRMPFISFFLAIFIVSIISTYINDTGTVRFLLYHRYFFQYYMVLLFFVNSDLDESDLIEINKLFIQVLILQVIVATIKWALIPNPEGSFGNENYTGTYALNDGSAFVLITMIAFSFVLPAFLLTGSRKYLFFMLLFLWFVIVGSKRGIIVMLPVLTLFIYILMNQKKVNFKAITATILIIFGSVSLITSINQTLNPEGERGGSALDLVYLAEYIVEYELGAGYYTQGQKWGGVDAEGFYSSGRLSTPIVLYQNLSDQGKLLTGLGTGSALNSGRIESSASSTFLSIGIEGGVSGFSWVVVQIGYLGGILFTFFLLRVFWMTWRKYTQESHNNSDSVFLIGLLGFIFTFLFDYMLYSQSMIRGEWYYCLFFYLIYKIHYFSIRNIRDN